jgi:hypothetical protein
MTTTVFFLSWWSGIEIAVIWQQLLQWAAALGTTLAAVVAGA